MKKYLTAAAVAAMLAGAPAVSLAAPGARVVACGLALAPAQVAAPADAAPAASAPPAASQGASAATDAPADAATDWQANVVDLVTAVMAGRWLDAVVLAMLLIVAGLRAFGRKISPWFATRAGGWTLNLSSATMLSMAVSLRTTGGLTFGTLLDALLIGLAAAGGYQALRDVKHARDEAIKRAGVV